MSSFQKSSKSDFVVIEDPKEWKRYLDEGVKFFSSAIVWTKDQNQTLFTNICGYEAEEGFIYAWIPKGFDVKTFASKLSKLDDDTCFFSVSLSQANIFFKTKFIKETVQGMQFDFPEAFFKVQRRKSFRMQIPDGWVMYVHFTDPIIAEKRVKAKVLDISAGGVSIVIPHEDAAGFETGAKLKDFVIRIRNEDLIGEGEVRHCVDLTLDKPNSKHSGVKIGIMFNHFSEKDIQKIARYVLEESRKYFTRFM